MDVKVTASPEWDTLAWRLARFDQGELRKEYGKAIRKATAGAPAAVRTAVPSHVPSGYAPVLAPALQFRTRPIVAGVNIGAQARGKSHPRQIDNIDAGRLRAPSYPKGRRAGWPWHVQAVRPGFFTKTIADMEPKVRDALKKVMDEITARIAGG